MVFGGRSTKSAECIAKKIFLGKYDFIIDFQYNKQTKSLLLKYKRLSK